MFPGIKEESDGGKRDERNRWKDGYIPQTSEDAGWRVTCRRVARYTERREHTGLVPKQAQSDERIRFERVAGQQPESESGINEYS